jgi:6-phosphogluconolactonase
MVDWSGVDVYLGDERCVPPEDPDSNHRMIAEVLLGVVGPVASDHPMYRSGPPEDEAARYQGEIADLATFDLVHLGMGPDGHTASLFPGSTGLAVTDPHTLVVANRDPNAANPHDRISLTLSAIARARLVVFTVSGASKRQAFEQVVAGADLPAARVSADEVIWLIDADTAGDTAGDTGGS